jgi:uncharacterized OB-fold protein
VSDDSASRPVPDTRNAGARYWAAAANGVLLVPKCVECARTFWHPRPRCPHCGSNRVDWIESAGRGAIHTFTIVRQTSDSFFRTQLPYAVAMIDLDEGVRLMSSVVQTPLDALRIGMRVEVQFEQASDDIGIPCFRASNAS